ncbi:MAG: Fe-S cluster assembly protein SufD [Candidatus Eremiobacteraeota bacterium]|nr:Fe-S cluster assembly protein SufD [Candidatus Eremiobacteraeota bacterium]MBV8354044.1 Fe-S cluster assembly protein SufD [Candidatus Eremiobacteraeota bacterium]
MALLSPPSLREEALEAYRALPAPGPAPGRFWKIDVGRIDAERIPVVAAETTLSLDPSLEAGGVIVCDLPTALREHADLVAAAQTDALDWRSHKFAALNVALRNAGMFVYIPDGLVVSNPIEIRRRAGAGAVFPYTLVVARPGSDAIVVSRLEGGDDETLVSDVVEVFVAPSARLRYTAIQELDPRARAFAIKRGKLEQDAALDWAVAELGSGLSVGEVYSALEGRGAETTISGVFFADGAQHVDLKSEVDHRVGDSRSETIFKTAATGDGQARYLGNIRIHPHATGSDATLRDDALLLSASAHIDSIPALEIASNDVRAFHGATVGAIREDEIFYAMTRGLERREAERMIALGFFEPAINRFPSDQVRDALRDALARKIG